MEVSPRKTFMPWFRLVGVLVALMALLFVFSRINLEFFSNPKPATTRIAIQWRRSAASVPTLPGRPVDIRPARSLAGRDLCSTVAGRI